MKTHELAKLLLTLPNLPVATHANNHDFMSELSTHGGTVRVGLLKTYGGDHIVIGNFTKKMLNRPNWYITNMYLGDVPEQWGKW